MSIKAMNWAWEQTLPPGSKLILMSLADAADEDGLCWPRIRVLAQKCCTSERTVQRTLKDLEAKGYLRVDRRYRRDGSQSSNAYYLHLSTCPDKLSPLSDKPTSQGVTGGAPSVTPTSSPHDEAMAPLEPPTNLKKESPQLQQADMPNTPPPSPVPGGLEKGASGALVWPSKLGESARQPIASMLQGIGLEPAQTLLDELDGVMTTRSIKTSPERWFRAVVVAYRKGQFQPTAALSVQARRHREAHDKDDQRTPSEPRTVAKNGRQHLTQINELLGRKRASGE